ncbi:MAG: DUF2027 domain-containing protein [Bacteroidales bacterium]|jgi:hypothetical protein|nr:DUF2027 domain-containing protein [Bacteroidales bacterium]
MIKVGDKVKFLNDVGGGTVTGFVNKTTVNVEGTDNFVIPYPISQLVNISETERIVKNEIPKPEVEHIKQATQLTYGKDEWVKLAGKDSPDFYFCFVPNDAKNPLSGKIGLWLVNDSNFLVLYYYSHYKDEKFRLAKFGLVQPNSKSGLESIDQSDLTDLPDFVFRLFYFAEEEKKLHPEVVKKFKINPTKFYKEKSFQPNTFFNKNAMLLHITPNLQSVELDKLTDEDLQKIIHSKEVVSEPKIQERTRPVDIVEVDLHIQELIDNTAGLSNKEMLCIQLEKVESEMRSAIKTNVKRIVFIHGLGQGVLKQEVVKLLRSKFPKYYFQDASFKEYGYGATMVILKRG